MTTISYYGFSYEQASREAKRLLQSKDEWISILDRLIELRAIMQQQKENPGPLVM